MSSTELPTMSPLLRHSDTTTVERGGMYFRIGENVLLRPEHYRYGDPMLEPCPITLNMLWMGELRLVDGVVMVPLEGIEIAPVPGRKRSILANFDALCVAPPMNPEANDTYPTGGVSRSTE